MESNHFDTLARLLGADRSRRRLLAGLASTVPASLLLALGMADAETKKKKKKKHKQKRSPHAGHRHGVMGRGSISPRSRDPRLRSQ